MESNHDLLNHDSIANQFNSLLNPSSVSTHFDPPAENQMERPAMDNLARGYANVEIESIIPSSAKVVLSSTAIPTLSNAVKEK